jgi:hypothetical protein
MTKLSLLDAEVRRVLGRISARKSARLQESLVALCDAHWTEMRGQQPLAPLARAVWEARRPLAHVFIDLYARADPRLDDILNSVTPAHALALLVLSEIAHGNTEGARLAYDSMMLFESSAARNEHTRSVLAELAAPGRHGADRLARNRPRLLRATAAIAAHIGRYDSSAVFSAIRVIAQAQASSAQYSGDPALQALLETMKHLGVIFLGFESGRLFYASNGTGKKSVPVKRLVDFLAQARQQRVL